MGIKHAIRGAAAPALFALLAGGCTVTTAPASPPAGGSGTPTTGNGSTDAPPSAGPGGSTEAEAADNDDFAHAQAVTSGATIMARWEKPEDKDFYAITIPAGQDGYLQVTVTETDPNVYPRGVIYKSDRSELVTASAPDGTTNPFSFKLNVSAGKQYFVVLDDVLGSPTAITAYTAKFEFIPVADAFETNDDFADAKPLTAGAAFDLVLFAGVETNDARDVDFFSVDVPPGKTKLHVQITNNSTADDPQCHEVTLYDADKVDQSSFNAPNPRANLTHDFNLPASSKIYLRIDDILHHNSATSSKVTVTFL